MDKHEIFDLITRHAREVLPDLEFHEFRHDDALKDLGANSIDRSEIVMMAMESLSLRVSLVEVARAQNIGELAERLHELQAKQVA